MNLKRMFREDGENEAAAGARGGPARPVGPDAVILEKARA